MKKNDMEAHIKERLPYLISEQKNAWKENERLRKEFIADYSPSRILNMDLDDFVQGKESKTSFCYRIEHSLICLGSMSGAQVSKFGVWYDKDQELYRTSVSRWGMIQIKLLRI